MRAENTPTEVMAATALVLSEAKSAESMARSCEVRVPASWFTLSVSCRHVPRDRAAEVIAGYTVVNDVSVRDWQLRTPTMTMGKSFDTHGPIGPCIVTADEIGDPHRLGLRCFVNGEQRQDGNTAELIHSVWSQIA